LSWVIDGAFEYFKTNSLNPPESVRVKQDSYKKSQDTVAMFFQEDVIEEGEKGYSDTWVSSAQCNHRYLARCKANNVSKQKLSNTEFGKRLKAKLGREKAKDINWKRSNGTKYHLCLTQDDTRGLLSRSLLTF
jgi:phage/plasmid-associated DNA primase